MLEEQIAQLESPEEKLLEVCQALGGVTCLDDLKRRISFLLQYENKLELLEIYGVDNWSGYSDALNDVEGYLDV